MLHHRIQDEQQLMHTRRQRHLRGLAGRPQPGVERLNHRIAAAGGQGPHIEHRPDRRAPARHRAATPLGPAVPVERGHPDQGGDLLAIQGAQLRETGEQGPREHRAHPGRALQQLLLRAPDRTLPDRAAELVVQGGQAPIEPGQVRLDLLAHRLEGAAEAVLLGRAHREELPTARQQGVQRLRRGIRQWSGDGPHRFGELGQNGGIEGVGLRELARRLREVAHLPRVDHHHGQAGRRERPDQGELEPAGGFQDNQGRCPLLQATADRGGAACIVGGDPPLAARAQGGIHALFGDINTDEQGRILHDGLLLCGPVLQMRAADPDNCSGSTGEGRDDPRYCSVSDDPDPIGLSRPSDSLQTLNYIV